MLVVYIDDIRGWKNYTCTITFKNEQYDMIANHCVYSLIGQSYFYFINTSNERSAFGLPRSKIHINETLFSCLPLISGYSIYVDIYENIFFKTYFKNAYFINTEPNITHIYRLHKYEAVFDKEFEVFNYMLIKYDATNDLQDRNGYKCLS